MVLTVNPWIVIGVLWLALFGVVFWWRVARGAVADVWEWWRRDRVAELLEDNWIVAGKCGTCWAENGGEGCDWAMCGCACHDDDALEELPPERSWQEMTADQPIIVDRVTLWHGAERERRAPWWEAEQRAAYESMGFEFPSGLLARVRELTP